MYIFVETEEKKYGLKMCVHLLDGTVFFKGGGLRGKKERSRERLIKPTTDCLKVHDCNN